MRLQRHALTFESRHLERIEGVIATEGCGDISVRDIQSANPEGRENRRLAAVRLYRNQSNT